MDAGPEQNFVRIDVAHPTQESLVQQQRLDAALVALYALEKGVRADLKRIGTKAGRRAFAPAHRTELSNVVEEDLAPVEYDHRARVRTALAAPQELAGHAEMDEQAAMVEIEQHRLAEAAHATDGPAGQLRRPAAVDPRRKPLDTFDAASLGVSGESSRNGLSFGEFGHYRIKASMLFLILLVLGLSLLAPGCRREAKRVVGVVPKGANHIFWQTVHAGAIKAAREEDLEVEWNAPTLEIDASRQIGIVESMVNRRLAGIALAPVDRTALVGVVERAWREGIPVAIYDSGIDTDKRITYVATDNLEGGRIAARRLGAILGGKGKVGIIGFMPGSASTMEREQGFQEEMRAMFPAVEIVALQFGMADRAKAMAATENLLTAHPDLAGLFADNESSSMGAVQALKGRGARNVKLVAFDASDQLIADLRSGWMDSLVVQNPFKMGYESTKAVALKLAGKTPPAHVDSGVRLVLRGELEQPDVKDLLFPDIGRWLNTDTEPR